jgi:hypothetical protein
MYFTPSAFRHPTSKSKTGAFRYLTGSPYSGTGLDPDSAFFFIPIPDFSDAEQSGISSFTKTVRRKKGLLYTLYFHTACGEKTPCTSILQVVEKHPARPHCWWRKDTLNVHIAVGGTGKRPARPHCWWWKDTLYFHILLVVKRHPARPHAGGEKTP